MILITVWIVTGLLVGFGVRFVGTWKQNAAWMENAPFIGIAAAMLTFVASLTIDVVFDLKDHFPVWLQLSMPLLTGIAVASCIAAFFAAKFIIEKTGAGLDHLGEAARVRWDDYRADRNTGQETQ